MLMFFRGLPSRFAMVRRLTPIRRANAAWDSPRRSRSATRSSSRVIMTDR